MTERDEVERKILVTLRNLDETSTKDGATRESRCPGGDTATDCVLNLGVGMIRSSRTSREAQGIAQTERAGR